MRFFNGEHDPLLHCDVKVHCVLLSRQSICQVGDRLRTRTTGGLASRIDDRFCNNGTGFIGELYIRFLAVTVFLREKCLANLISKGRGYVNGANMLGNK